MIDIQERLVTLKKENAELMKQLHNCPLPNLSTNILWSTDIEPPACVTEVLQYLVNCEGLSGPLSSFPFCVCNAISRDTPIVYASPAFTRLTGYETLEVFGKNCRFLRGPDTSAATVSPQSMMLILTCDIVTDMIVTFQVNTLRERIAAGLDCCCVVLNYKKSGEAFWNRLRLAHLKDPTERTFLLVGLLTEVTAASAGSVDDFCTDNIDPTVGTSSIRRSHSLDLLHEIQQRKLATADINNSSSSSTVATTSVNSSTSGTITKMRTSSILTRQGKRARIKMEHSADEAAATAAVAFTSSTDTTSSISDTDHKSKM